MTLPNPPFSLTYQTTSVPLKVTPEMTVTLAAESGIVLQPGHEREWAEVLNGLNKSAQAILEMDDYLPQVDLARYPRTDIHVPKNTAGGGWALKVVWTSSSSPGNIKD